MNGGSIIGQRAVWHPAPGLTQPAEHLARAGQTVTVEADLGPFLPDSDASLFKVRFDDDVVGYAVAAELSEPAS